MTPAARFLVVGIGNPDRGDDGIGPFVARRLRGHGSPDVAIIERTGDALALIDDWAGRDAVILIDAALSGAAPGFVHRVDLRKDTLPPEFTLSYIRQTRVIEDYKSGGTNGWVSTLTDMVKENSDAPPSGGPVVLIMEDEEPIQHILVDAFEDGGFAVETAGTGARAVKLLNERGSHFRALITDINLPGKLSGWDVARVAREANEHIPVIYMTGDSANEWASKGVPNSILIIKPFAIAQVITAVSQLITANEAS